MKVWELNYDSNNFEGVKVVDGDWSFTKKFIGKSLLAEWKALEINVYEDAPRSDAPTFIGCAPLFSLRAVEAVKELVEEFIELLPTRFPREDYFILNVLNVLDCIDYEQSEAVRFDSGRVMYFEKYGFIPEIVKNQHIFKIKEIPKQTVFVSDAFRNAILENHLVGFIFKEVWTLT